MGSSLHFYVLFDSNRYRAVFCLLVRPLNTAAVGAGAKAEPGTQCSSPRVVAWTQCLSCCLQLGFALAESWVEAELRLEPRNFCMGYKCSKEQLNGRQTPVSGVCFVVIVCMVLGT